MRNRTVVPHCGHHQASSTSFYSHFFISFTAFAYSVFFPMWTSLILWRDTAFLFLMARKMTHDVTFKPENETGSDAAVQHEQPVLLV